MRYQSKEEAQQDHIQNYRSDGISKLKGTRYSSDFYRVRFLIENTPEKSLVLDVGCNGGTVAVPLEFEKKCHINGIDIVPKLVELAKKRGIFAEVGEAEDLSRYEDEKFDVVLCSEVLEHLFDPLEAIREAHRVLKPGGRYLVTVPHPNGFMCSEGKLGDYHQQNFSAEILDTLFHICFPRGNVKFINIPYVEEYCIANGINKEIPQWIGLEAIKSEVIKMPETTMRKKKGKRKK